MCRSALIALLPEELKMTIGLVGKKCGMTRIFKEDGTSIPVTVIQVLANKITQIKTEETDGYTAVQVTTGEKKASRVNKPMAGHFAKANVAPGTGLWEFRTTAETLSALNLGDEFTVNHFALGQLVDVTGISKGKGFAGTVKRHNFRTQDATHGNSRSHRVPGSIGQNQTPGRVFKGKKMCGHLGDEKVTTVALTITGIDAEKNLLLISGSVPGAVGGDVIVNVSTRAAS
jgi:large subunit ribosomal protein L3